MYAWYAICTSAIYEHHNPTAHIVCLVFRTKAHITNNTHFFKQAMHIGKPCHISFSCQPLKTFPLACTFCVCSFWVGMCNHFRDFFHLSSNMWSMLLEINNWNIYRRTKNVLRQKLKALTNQECSSAKLEGINLLQTKNWKHWRTKNVFRQR